MNNSFSSLINPVPVTAGVETSRFSGAAWAEFVQSQQVLIAGVGGIGSWLALMIARLNPSSMVLADDDRVERANMAGQLYTTNDVGRGKVEAVQSMLEKFANYRNVGTFNQRITSDVTRVPRIVMCGFDNMEARRTTYNVWASYNSVASPADKCLFIDGRLAAETLQVFCFTLADEAYRREYEQTWLFNDSEAESTVCSYKQTSYCANLIASIMTNLFVNWCANQCNPIIDRSVPFMTEYSGEQMFLKYEV